MKKRKLEVSRGHGKVRVSAIKKVKTEETRISFFFRVSPKNYEEYTEKTGENDNSIVCQVDASTENHGQRIGESPTTISHRRSSYHY